MNTLGEYSMEFNSKGMFRGVCDSNGNCSVGIWEEMIPITVDINNTQALSRVAGVGEEMTTSAAAAAVVRGAVAEVIVIDSSNPMAQILPIQ